MAAAAASWVRCGATAEGLSGVLRQVGPRLADEALVRARDIVARFGR